MQNDAPNSGVQPLPLPRNGNGAGHRNARPINSPQGGRNRSGTGNGSQFEGARSPPGAKNLSHVPCKFFRSGQCQAGNACPFSHDVDHGEQLCKYFAKGNCKFGPKCANLHVDQYGRVLNRRDKSLSSYNLGGRHDNPAYQPQAPPYTMLPEDYHAGTGPFTNQIPPIGDLEGAVPIPLAQPYDDSEAQFGSLTEEGRYPMSPPLLRTMNEVGLPSSFDSKGSSTYFKHGPIAASVPSKFFGNMQSPPSSMPRQGMLSGEAARGFGDSIRSKPAPYGASPNFPDDEHLAPRLLHSQQRHKSRGTGFMSTSLPVKEEWEKDDDDYLLTAEEDYVPSDLLNSQIRHKDDREDGQSGAVSSSAPRDFNHRGSFLGGNGFGSPDNGAKWGSPSMASPGNSRFTDIFIEQKRNQEQAAGSPFGPVGSPRRSTILGSSPFERASPISGGVSNLTLGLRDMKVSGSEKPVKPTPSAASHRLSSEMRATASRTVSSNSVGKRIEEEPQDFVFALDDEDLNSPSKEKAATAPWGKTMSPSFGAIGGHRKSSMSGKSD